MNDCVTIKSDSEQEVSCNLLRIAEDVENVVSSKHNKYTIPQNSEAHTTPILCRDDLISEVLRS